MSTVIVEREFSRPVSEAVLHDAERRSAWCMDAYGVHPRLHYLARDGKRVVCVFSAPDAEALRQVAKLAGLDPRRRIWSCSVHDADDADTDPPRLRALRSTVNVVESTFSAPLEPGRSPAAGTLAPTDFGGARWLRTYRSADGLREISLFESRDPAPVLRASKGVLARCDRIWEASIVLPLGPEPPGGAPEA